MFVKLISLSLAALSTPALGAPAGDPVKNDFRRSARILPQRAQAIGYQQFGDLHLASFLSRVERVQVTVKGAVVHKKKVGPFDAERDGAEWRNQGEGSIAVNGPRWNKTAASSKPMLALHESLGALSFHDEDFGCSASLWALTDSSTRATLSAEELASFEANAHQSCRMARGGSTGVTGGGDDYNVRIRINIMKSGLSAIRSARSAQERSRAFDKIQGSFYQGYFRSSKSIDFEAMRKKVTLPKKPIVDTIRVTSEGRPVPYGAPNGWTWDAASNSILLPAWAEPKELGLGATGVGVFYESERPN